MAVPEGVIFIHNGTHASIPANWSRETKLDGRFIKGTADSVEPDVEGGAATHTHTSAAHTHAMQGHTHTVTIAAATNTSTTVINAGSTILVRNHVHAPYASGAVASASISSEEASYDAFSNNPPYYEVVFIKPSDGAQTGVPDGECALIDVSSLPSGWSEVTALRNKFLRGAAALGNAGGTGGTTTNVHDLTHTHTVSHAHAAKASSTVAATRGSSGTGTWLAPHTHTQSLDSDATAPSDTPSLTTTETVEPAYRTLIVMQNGTGVNSLPIGIVGMWLGALGDIPAGWSELTSMREKYLKVAASTGTVGASGGANTHTHASQAHVHTGISHTHTANPATYASHTGTLNRDSSGSSLGDAQQATHDSTAVSTDTYNLENGSTTAASSSNEPLNTTVAFIKLDRYNYTGSFIFNLL